MTDPNYTHVALLLDRSGSMERIRSDAEGGVKTFCEEQAKVTGRCTFELFQFDHEFEQVYAPKPIGEVKNIALVPRGRTALLDAMGRAITMTGEWLAARPEQDRPALVVFAVVTDGWENASGEWTREKVFDLVKRQQDEFGWKFAFLAANQDAIKTGAGLGVPQASTMSYQATGQSVASTYSTLSDSVTRTRGGGEFVMPDEAPDKGEGS